MQVSKLATDIARLEPVSKAAGQLDGQTSDAPKHAHGGGHHRHDNVQLSDAGLALSSDTVTTDSATAGGATSTLDPQQVDAIRSRILSGAYDSLSVAHKVANAILRSGDL